MLKHSSPGTSYRHYTKCQINPGFVPVPVTVSVSDVNASTGEILHFCTVSYSVSVPDLYASTGEMLGEGAFGLVKTYRNVVTNKEFAVKVIWTQIRSVKLVYTLMLLAPGCKQMCLHMDVNRCVYTKLCLYLDLSSCRWQFTDTTIARDCLLGYWALPVQPCHWTCTLS